MNTTTPISTGDVIEFVEDGEQVSALVLLAADDNLILDRCDGSTPTVVRTDELVGLRRFLPELIGLAA